ncbi:MAG: hypothetical protein AAF950_00160 [Pseudomonadota bacterium]
MSPLILCVVGALILLIGFFTWKAPRLTSVIWWSLVTTIFVTAALLLALPGPFSEKALWITIFVPLIWVLFQFWCYWDGNKWRVAGGLIATSAISAIIVFSIDPLV